MKKRHVWRYTCEHCKKSNCSGGAMAQHELRCFRNPARCCPVCEAQWPLDWLVEPMKALEEIEEATEEALIAKLREAVEGCPACMCAAIMQAKLPMIEWDTPGEYHFGEFCPGSHGSYRYRVKWDYGKERDAYRAEQRASEEERVFNQGAF